MPSAFHIPGRFHPAYSLLGRCIRKRNVDSLRGEARYILTSVLIGSALVLAQTVLFTFLSPTSVNVLVAAGLEAAVVLIFLMTCVIGWQPRITVTLSERCLVVDSADGRRSIPLDAIAKTSRIDSHLYYRHYRRYERTLAFVNRIPATLLLIMLPDRPMVLGLGISDQERLERELAILAGSYHVA